MKYRISRRLFPITGIVTLTAALAMRVDASEWLRGGFGWRWPYIPLDLPVILPLLGVIFVYLGGAYYVLRSTRRARYAVAWSMLGTFVIVIAAIAVREGDVLFALFARTASELGTGSHWVASHVDWAGGEWRDWGAEMTSFGGHLSNLPPGSVFWYAGLSNLLDHVPAVANLGQRLLMPFQCQNYALLTYTPGQWASTLFGMAMPLWAALTPIVIYAVARRIIKVDIRPIMLWYPLIPALSGFAGSWSTIYPLIALMALLTLMQGCQKHSPQAIWCYLSGLICGIGLFINFALIPLCLLLIIWLVVSEIVVKRRSPLHIVLISLYYVIGLSTVWIIFWLVTGQTIFDLLSSAMAFHLSLDRPYAFWVFIHPWDWLLWGALGLGILTIVNLVRWLNSRKYDLSTMPTLSITLALTMLILVISGSARGETGRVWLFFTPFLLITAVESRHLPTQPITQNEWLWIGVPQAFLVVALVTSIASTGTDFRPPQPPAQIQTNHVVNTMFTNESQTGTFRLIGWDGAVKNNILELRLTWEGIAPSNTPIWFGAVLVGSSGATIPVTAWQPGGETRYPTTCWGEGSVISDTITVPLNGYKDTEWWISLAAYGDASQPEGRLTVQSESIPADTQTGLGPVSGE